MTRARRPHTVLVAVNPFKGSLSAGEVAEACGRGARAAGWRADLMPAADGGDGMLDALRAGGVLTRTTTHRVAGPLDSPVAVDVGWLDAHSAVIESRFVVGLGLVPPDRRDPGAASTRGLGDLILAVGRQGARQVRVGLGGSATMDGGVGMAGAWGWQLRGESGNTLPPLGESLDRVHRVRPGTPPPVALTALVDVEHPLLGPDGARRFAAQKGATGPQEEVLANGLARLVHLLGPEAVSAASEAGAGAAGGLGFGLRFFGGARLARGAEWILDRLGFARRLHRADAVLTAEGAFDDTSVGGKLTGTVIRLARDAGIPVGLLAPTARDVPDGVLIETGGGRWDEAHLAERAAALVRRLSRLPPP